MVAGARFALHRTGPDALGEPPRRKDVVQSPPDVALSHVPPGRPPGEEVGIVRFELPMHVDQTSAEHPLDECALFRTLSGDSWLSFLWVDIQVGACHVHVPAQYERRPRRLELR